MMEPSGTRQGEGAGTRQISRKSPDFMAAIHLALGAPGRHSADRPHPIVTEFLDDADVRSLRVDPLVATFSEGKLVAAAAGVESPGSAALVLAPTEMTDPAAIIRFVPTVRSVCDRLRGRSVSLTELLVPSRQSPWSAVAESAGLHYLTDLLYLVRNAGYHAAHGQVRRDVCWIPMTDQAQQLFEQTLTSTYEDSADCPELCGIRTAKDVLAGHRAAGGFDQTLWSVAMHNEQPVGIILLARLPRHNALELVYMGVARSARNQGFADALLRRAVDTMHLEGANTLALAVDTRNAPARRVYQRWSFSETGRRSAWITSPEDTIACDRTKEGADAESAPP